MKANELGDFTSEEIRVMENELHTVLKSLNLKPFDTLLLAVQAIANLYSEYDLREKMDSYEFSRLVFEQLIMAEDKKFT